MLSCAQPEHFLPPQRFRSLSKAAPGKREEEEEDDGDELKLKNLPADVLRKILGLVIEKDSQGAGLDASSCQSDDGPEHFERARRVHSLRLVCHTFRDTVDRAFVDRARWPAFVGDDDPQSPTSGAREAPTPVDIRWLRARFPRLRHLHLMFVADADLIKVAKSCGLLRGLQTLVLHRCSDLDAESVADALSSATGLRALSLNGSIRVEDRGLAPLANLPHLTSLDAGRMSRLSCAAMVHIGSCAKLKDLRLGGCTRLFQPGSSAAERAESLGCSDSTRTLLGRTDTAATINLGGDGSDGAASPPQEENEPEEGPLAVLARSAKALDHLELPRMATNDALRDIGRMRLRSLKLQDAAYITGDGLAHLSGPGHAMPFTLKVLDCTGCTGVDDGATPAIARLSSLESLCLSFTGVTNDGMAALLRLPRLKRLGVACTAVSRDAALKMRKKKYGLAIIGLWVPALDP